MIDLSLMKGIHVDPKARTARAQGGVTWNEFNRETQLHGLATTGGVVSTTGIAGLTLGGGLGWLMGKYALALDNLLSVELVLADGSVLTASADENADLFWALRGGGGNFGVAASFEYRLHPVGPIVTGGRHRLPVQRGLGRAAVLPRRHRVAPRRDHGIRRSDPRTRRIGHEAGGNGGVSLRAARRRRERRREPIKQFGAPVMDVIGPMPYSPGQHDAGCGLSPRRAQLLEVELPRPA